MISRATKNDAISHRGQKPQKPGSHMRIGEYFNSSVVKMTRNLQNIKLHIQTSFEYFVEKTRQVKINMQIFWKNVKTLSKLNIFSVVMKFNIKILN